MRRGRLARRVLAAAAPVLALPLLVMAAPPARAAVTGVANPSPIGITSPTVVNAVQPASPYPSTIAVSGLAGLVTDVNVTLVGLTHPVANDLDILLVGPTGQSIVLLSDPGGDGALVSAANATVTFDDSAAGAVPTSGSITGAASFRPTDQSSALADSFPPPAPTPGTATTLAAAFTGTDPNGTWSVYVVDDSVGDDGAVAGGWSLSITDEVAAAATTTTIASSPNPSTTGAGVTFTATVTSAGAPVGTGTVTFSSGGAPLASAVALDASGHAALTTTALTEGSHPVTATYNGSSGLLTSNGSVTQVVDTATTTPTPGTWCNTGGLTVPTAGPATPFPSRVTISGVGGSTTLLAVRLTGVAHTAPVDLDIWLVGPTGASLMLMSDVGGTAAAAADLTFADAAAGGIPAAGPLASGTYRPSDDDGAGQDVFPAPAPLPSAATTLSTFDGVSPDGIWRLFVLDDAGGDAGSVGGWCLDVSTAATTTTVLTSSPNPSGVGQPVTLTATVTSGATPVTEGTVTISDGATVLASGLTPDATGQVGATTSALAAGSHAITAGYAGTPAFQPSASASVTHTVLDAAADAGGPYTIAEGDALTLDGSASVPSTGVDVSWDVDGDGSFGDATTLSPTLTWDQLVALGVGDGTGAPGTVTLRISNGPAASTDTATLTVDNVAPTAVLGNDGPVAEGSTATVTFGSVFDPSPDDLATLSYRYDFDNDGAVDLTGTSPSATVPASYLDVGPSTRTVRAVVADDDGGTTELTTAIVVTAAAPRATIDGPSSAVVGQPLTIKVGAVDPSSADMAGVFQFAVDWGDGTPVESLSGPADPPVSHTYTTAGTFVVTATATDADGATSAPLTFTVVVSATPPPVDTPAPTEPATEASTGTLADTGSAGVPGALRLGGLLVIAGLGLVLATARRRRRST
ncbi:MAG: Ig-like domain repeat protein [Dermatophilaceae bacterium]